jgi:serine phosphatase RsbU (regulator of sigma subunit)
VAFADITVRYVAAARRAEVGGDWYDVFRRRGGGVMVVVGDVAGHDSRAAAAMGQLRGLLRGIGFRGAEDPGEVLRGVDEAIEELELATLATAVLAEISPPEEGTGGVRLRWSNAGHPPPVLVDATGGARLLETRPDLLLGLDDEANRSDHDLTLAPGETLVLYTDGLVERRGVPVTKGMEWLVGTLHGRHRESVEQICDGLLAEADAGGDDVALLVLRA